MISEVGKKEYYCDSKKLKRNLENQNNKLIKWLEEKQIIINTTNALGAMLNINNKLSFLVGCDDLKLFELIYYYFDKINFNDELKKTIKRDKFSLKKSFITNITSYNHLIEVVLKKELEDILKQEMKVDLFGEFDSFVQLPNWVWSDLNFASYLIWNIKNGLKQFNLKNQIKINEVHYAGGSFEIYIDDNYYALIQWPYWKKEDTKINNLFNDLNSNISDLKDIEKQVKELKLAFYPEKMLSIKNFIPIKEINSPNEMVKLNDDQIEMFINKIAEKMNLKRVIGWANHNWYKIGMIDKSNNLLILSCERTWQENFEDCVASIIHQQTTNKIEKEYGWEEERIVNKLTTTDFVAEIASTYYLSNTYGIGEPLKLEDLHERWPVINTLPKTRDKYFITTIFKSAYEQFSYLKENVLDKAYQYVIEQTSNNINI